MPRGRFPGGFDEGRVTAQAEVIVGGEVGQAIVRHAQGAAQVRPIERRQFITENGIEVHVHRSSLESRVKVWPET